MREMFELRLFGMLLSTAICLGLTACLPDEEDERTKHEIAEAAAAAASIAEDSANEVARRKQITTDTVTARVFLFTRGGGPSASLYIARGGDNAFTSADVGKVGPPDDCAAAALVAAEK